MKKSYLRLVMFFQAFLIFGSLAVSAQLQNSWQLFETVHPVDKLIVALHIDVAAGAVVDNTGASDVTAAFQQAIDNVFDLGGGAIYVPAGHYRFDGTIVVREGVNLRGDFTVPEGAPVAGTILDVWSGRNSQDSIPFITLRGSASVDGFAIWYPEQDAAAIAYYPPSISFEKNPDARYPKHASRARCINLVNSYFGLDIGIINTAIPMVFNIYGSPLKKGIRINECTDVSRLMDIHLSPDYWSNSGLPGSPAADGPHSVFMYNEGQAVEYIRSDNGFNGFWYISGYSIGLSINSGYSAGPFYELEITNCKEALILITTNQVPACFTSCIFEGSEAALVLDEMVGTAQFNATSFKSETLSVKPAGPGSNSGAQLSFQNCTFDAPAQLTGLLSSIANSNFNFDGNHVTLDGDLKNAILMDNTYEGGRSIVNNMSNKENALIRDTTKTYLATPEFEYIPFIAHGPTRAEFYMATDFEGVVEGDGLDDGPGLQLALDKAALDGGGIVFLPAGEYRLDSPITVPENVELRGVLDMPHHGRLMLNKDLEHEFGSFIYVYHGRGSSEGASITISANAGVRGISVYYPEQYIHLTGVPQAFPWLFRLNGENIYIKNVCAVNPYQLIDIAFAKSDNHYIENIFTFPLMTGIRVGKASEGGKLRNIHYNGTMINQAFYPHDDDKLKNWSHAYMESFKFGDMQDEEMLFCFTRACFTGITMEEESGVGPNGVSIGFGVESVTKGACVDVTGNNGFTFINASLLSESSTINFESQDTLILHNTRTKTSPYFIKSESQIGKLVFNQVLHRGSNTMIKYNEGEVELVNALFLDGLKINLDNPAVPLRIYGGFLKTGTLFMNLENTQVYWDYLPDLDTADPDILFNPDLFLFPGIIEVTDYIGVEQKTEIEEVILYPNPASEIVNLNWRQEGDFQVWIFDAVGKLIYSESGEANHMSIDINLIGEPGLYYVQISNQNMQLGRMLLIQ